MWIPFCRSGNGLLRRLRLLAMTMFQSHEPPMSFSCDVLERFGKEQLLDSGFKELRRPDIQNGGIS